MHDGEGRHGRSRPYPSLDWRVLIGAFMGTYLGALEGWFIGPFAQALAVMAEKPNFASASVLSLTWGAAERLQEVVLRAPGRCVAGTVSALIQGPNTSVGIVALAAGAGALLGALLALFARTS